MSYHQWYLWAKRNYPKLPDSEVRKIAMRQHKNELYREKMRRKYGGVWGHKY